MLVAALVATAAFAGVPHTSTAYCLSGKMADGSYTRARSVAHNGYPLGTKITVDPPFRGVRRWVVRDRIGHGTQLDFWTPSCANAIRYGRKTVKVRKGW